MDPELGVARRWAEGQEGHSWQWAHKLWTEDCCWELDWWLGEHGLGAFGCQVEEIGFDPGLSRDCAQAKAGKLFSDLAEPLVGLSS